MEYEDDNKPIPIRDVWAVKDGKAELPCDIAPPDPTDQIYLVLWYRELAGKPLYSYDLRGKPPNAGRHWSAEPTFGFGQRANFRVPAAESNTALVIKDVSLMDEGVYRCRVDYRNSPTRNVKINLTVVEEPHAPQIKRDDEVLQDVGGAYAVSKFIRIGIADKNDNPPYFDKSLYEAEVDENEDIQHTVLTVTANDKDESSRIRYEITRGNFGGAFAVKNMTGAIYVAGYLDYETRRRYELRLVASDNLNENYTTVVIHVNDVNDNPPVFDRYTYETQITEEDDRNLPKRLFKVTATDGDKDRPENIVYFLTGQGIDTDRPDQSKFDINKTTGEIFVLKPLDRDEPNGRPQWRFTVFAQDEGGNGLVGYADATVNLKDINDNAPLFPQGVYFGNVTENGTAGMMVMTMTATDYDDLEEGTNAKLKYSIEKNVIDENTGTPIFEIEEDTGVIKTAVCCLDRERTPDYSIQVVAIDGGGLKGTGTASIRVKDINDMPPTFTKDEWVTEVDETDGNLLPDAPILTVTVHDEDESNKFHYKVIDSSGFGADKFTMVRNNDSRVAVRLGLDEDLLEDAVIISTTGVAAEYQGQWLGLYKKIGTINGSPYYKQIDSEGKGSLLYKGTNSFWYVSWKILFENFHAGAFRNRNSSTTIPSIGWEYWGPDQNTGEHNWSYNSGMWNLDSGLKVENVVDINYKTLCTSVNVSGNAQDFVGQYDAIRGVYSKGRMVYSSGKGKYLKVQPGVAGWVACDDKECSKRKHSVASGGGANSMNPAAIEAVSSRSRSPDRTSWRYYNRTTEWVPSNITLTCRETISKKKLLQNGIILSTSGFAAEYHAPFFGLYRKDIINGSPHYVQLGSGSQKEHSIKKWSNIIWYVSDNDTPVLRNRNTSDDLPTSGWEYIKNGEWFFDPNLKVENINDNLDDNDENDICSSVIVSEDAVQFGPYLGRFDAVNGIYSAGRLIYKNKSGIFLMVGNDANPWMICSPKYASELCLPNKVYAIILESGGGANSMNPTDPVASASRDVDKQRTSWGHGKKVVVNNYSIKVKCLD